MAMKRLLSMLLVLTILFSAPAYISAYSLPSNDNLKLDCRSGLLMEFTTGNIIYEYNSHDKLPPASVTKVMTTLLIMEAVENGTMTLGDKVTCSARAKSMGGSTMYLETGEIRTVEELLKGVCIESANDAAIALAEYHSGTEEAFVEKMNARAKELGCNDSNFSNCTGLYPDNHYTSAFDLAIMSRELLKHSQVLKYTTIWMETITEGRLSPFTLVNRNKMLRSYNGCDGLKTGFIKESMYCISATAKRNNIRFISIIMGAPTWQSRNDQAGRLLDYGFAKYESIKLVDKDEPVGEISIHKAVPERITIRAEEELDVILEKGTKANIEKQVEIYRNIKLPLKACDQIGVIKAVDGDKTYSEVKLVVDGPVNKMSFGYILKKSFKLLLHVDK
jgi:D-alanyl-D-alanine carboxypeptidase (penicillin-binding protein 5/6)